MARRRRRKNRVKRIAAALVLLAILLALLELNRFLPGTWPGGGGESGLRSRPLVGLDLERVRPPDGPLPPWPEDGIRVVLRAADGGVLQGGRVAPASAPAPDAVDGVARLADPAVLREGFRVDVADGAVRHGPADPRWGDTWVVHWPATSPPELPTAQGLDVEVRTAEGVPVEGVEVRGVGDVDAPPRPTDGQGRVHLADVSGPLRLEVLAPGRAPIRRWVHPSGDAPVVIRLPRAYPLPRAYADLASGEEVVPQRLTIRAHDGQAVWDWEAGLDPRPESVELSLDPTRHVLEVRSPTHPVVETPLADPPATLRIPRGRTVEVEAVDRRAVRLPGVRASAWYLPPWLGPADTGRGEPREVEVAGAATAILPRGQSARLLVRATHAAPSVVRLPAAEADARERVVLEPGAVVSVRVTDGRDAAAVIGARVEAFLSVSGLPLVLRARTDREGGARLTGLLAGPVEVYAHAPGRAWAGRVVEAAGPDAEAIPFRLDPGGVLRLVVEDPFGAPVAGAHVHAVPARPADGPDILPPDAEALRTGEDGTAVLVDVRDVPYRIRISHPRYDPAVLKDVRPGDGVQFATLVPRAGATPEDE